MIERRLKTLFLALISVAFAVSLFACGKDAVSQFDAGGNNLPDAFLEDDDDDNDDARLCIDDYDCLVGEKCIQNKCRYIGGSGKDCLTDLECPAGEICIGGVCEQEEAVKERPKQRCRDDFDCPVGYYCEAQWCVEGSGSTCVNQGDCREGEICIGFRCKRGTRCVTDEDCAEGQICVLDKQQCVDKLPTDGRMLMVEPQYIDFGAVAFGSTVHKKITLKSTGEKDVEILKIEFDKFTGPSFKFDPMPPVSPGHVLAPGGSVSFNVIYTPDDAKPDVGSVEIYNNTLYPQIPVPLASSYKGQPDFVVLDPKDESQIWPAGGTASWIINFDTVEVGNIINKEYIIRNRGNGTAILAIENLAFKQDAALNTSQFEYVFKDKLGMEITSPLYLNPGEEIEATFTYKPDSKGQHKAILEADTNDSDINGDAMDDAGDLMIELVGAAGIEPGIFGYAPALMDFGLTEVGTTSTPKSLKLQNFSGDSNINVTYMCMPSTPMNEKQRFCGEFEFEKLPSTLYPGQAETIPVFFVPRTKGDKEKIIQIHNDSENLPLVEVSLIGQGAKAGMSIVPATNIVFPPTSYGSSAPDIDVFITNTGTSKLTIYSIDGPIGDPELFIRGNIEYQSGGRVTFPVELQPSLTPIAIKFGFTPQVKGKKYMAEVKISHSPVENATETTINLSGEGTDCADDYIDLTGMGCTYYCKLKGPFDAPDLAPPFEDANCDGIDGTIATSVFVSALGRPGARGTMDDPLPSIEEGIQRARQLGYGDVLVSQGDYNLSAPLRMVEGINIYGGYIQNKVAPSCPLGWCRDATSYPVLRAPMGQPAVIFENIQKTTIINRLSIFGGDNSGTPGGNSLAIKVENSAGVEIMACKVKSGIPGKGATGTPAPVNSLPNMYGTSGGSGGDGKEAGHSITGCLFCSCGSAGSGGTGGYGKSCPSGGISGSGGFGGGGGNPKDQGQPGQNGQGPMGGGGGQPSSGAGDTPNPSIAPSGQDGEGGDLNGVFVNKTWQPTTAGTGGWGENGSGGGGGAGGKGKDCGLFCCPDKGGGGGGGGSGGCGGQGGGGGQGGYGSFGIFLINSTARVAYTEVITSQGGAGGNGGAGQHGAPGGSGADGGKGFQDASPGGKGGTGQQGGTGGAGGGGAGGPSVGIFSDSTSVVDVSANTYTIGGGGTGGASSGSSGPNGLSCARLTWLDGQPPSCTSY